MSYKPLGSAGLCLEIYIGCSHRSLSLDKPQQQHSHGFLQDRTRAAPAAKSFPRQIHMTSLVDSAQTARARPRVSLPMLKPHRSIGALPLEAARRWRQGERLSRHGRDVLVGLAVDLSTRRRDEAPRERREAHKKNAQVQDAMRHEAAGSGHRTRAARAPWFQPGRARLFCCAAAAAPIHQLGEADTRLPPQLTRPTAPARVA